MAHPPLRPDSERRHLLVLPADVGADEVEILAQSRFPRAVWEVVPGTRRGDPGVLRLSRLSTLQGPYATDRTTAANLRTPAGIAYVLVAPVERGPRPAAEGGDREGLRRAFPDGLPVRDELRGVLWLIAAARRLGGAVRIAPTDRRGPTVLVPDPGAAVDLTVWSDLWLEPDAALALMRQVVPGAELNFGRAWSGPVLAAQVPGTEVLTAEQRAALHEIAAEFDAAALADQSPLEAYGVLAELGVDGFLALEIGGETDLPPAVGGLPWAGGGAVAYRIRWGPPDLAEAEAERPSLPHRVARGRAAHVVTGVARAVHAVVGGEITDQMDFLVDVADL